MDNSVNSHQKDLSSSLDNLFLLGCSFMILAMVFGVSLLNSALSTRKNSLYMMLFGVLSLCIASFQWFSIGSFMVLSEHGNSLVPDFRKLFAPKIFDSRKDLLLPEMVKLIIGWISSALNLCVLSATTSGRGRLSFACVFLFLWSFLVWNITTYWTHNHNGWANKLGIINSAGGGPSVALGTTSLAYSWYMGKRRNPDSLPHSNIMVYVATAIIWLGWCGIGGTLTMKFNQRAVLAIVNINIGGIFGGLTWFFVEYLSSRKSSLFAFCVGAIGGFIGVSTASTVVDSISAMLMGIVGSLVCNYATSIARLLRIDDHINLFAFQSVGSLASLFMGSVLSQNSLFGIKDDYVVPMGALQNNWKQLLVQLGYGIACGAWGLVITLLLILFIEKALRIKIRVKSNEEDQGLDKAYIGETAYPETKKLKALGSGSMTKKYY